MMRRVLLGLALAAVMVFAQEHAPAVAEHADHDAMLPWKWANFALLVLGLGYLASKMLPPFFAGRTAEIQKGLADAAAMQKESEAKVTAIEARLKNLEGEIASIRANAAAEMATEEARVRKRAKRPLPKCGNILMLRSEPRLNRHRWNCDVTRRCWRSKRPKASCGRG